jgi:hypothetical protein
MGSRRRNRRKRSKDSNRIPLPSSSRKGHDSTNCTARYANEPGNDVSNEPLDHGHER